MEHPQQKKPVRGSATSYATTLHCQHGSLQTPDQSCCITSHCDLANALLPNLRGMPGTCGILQRLPLEAANVLVAYTHIYTSQIRKSRHGLGAAKSTDPRSVLLYHESLRFGKCSASKLTGNAWNLWHSPKVAIGSSQRTGGIYTYIHESNSQEQTWVGCSQIYRPPISPVVSRVTAIWQMLCFQTYGECLELVAFSKGCHWKQPTYWWHIHIYTRVKFARADMGWVQPNLQTPDQSCCITSHCDLANALLPNLRGMPGTCGIFQRLPLEAANVLVAYTRVKFARADMGWVQPNLQTPDQSCCITSHCDLANALLPNLRGMPGTCGILQRLPLEAANVLVAYTHIYTSQIRKSRHGLGAAKSTDPRSVLLYHESLRFGKCSASKLTGNAWNLWHSPKVAIGSSQCTGCIWMDKVYQKTCMSFLNGCKKMLNVRGGRYVDIVYLHPYGLLSENRVLHSIHW